MFDHKSQLSSEPICFVIVGKVILMVELANVKIAPIIWHSHVGYFEQTPHIKKMPPLDVLYMQVNEIEQQIIFSYYNNVLLI